MIDRQIACGNDLLRNFLATIRLYAGGAVIERQKAIGLPSIFFFLAISRSRYWPPHRGGQ